MSGDKMLSEDLTQDVFYKVMKYRTSYKNGKFVSWIFTIARNSLNTHFTRDKDTHADFEHLENRIGEEKNEEDFSQLHFALNKLETSDREVIVMNRFQQIRYNEIAEIIGSTEGAVKTKVSRALKKLKTIYIESI